MLTSVSLLLAFLYGAGMVLLAMALLKRRPVQDGRYQPSVSIVVAARNEQEGIGACLASLAQLSYPRELLEVIVVDDHSTDQTRDIVADFAGSHPGFRLLSAGEPSGHLKGKVNALVTGIDEAKGEILMFTDADCRVPPTWVQGTVSRYADESIAMVGGFIVVEGESWFGGIQALDWLLLVSAASATASLRFPVTAVGNNLSIRRSAYDRVGGYRGIPFSITEDLALVKAVTSSGAGRIVIPLDPATAVRTHPCKRISDLYRQRKRWFVGGQGMRPTSALAFLVIHAFHLVLATGIFFLSPATWCVVGGVKLLADLVLILPSVRGLKMSGLVRYWIPFQIYLMLYILVLPVVAFLSGGITWKGRDFRGRV